MMLKHMVRAFGSCCEYDPVEVFDGEHMLTTHLERGTNSVTWQSSIATLDLGCSQTLDSVTGKNCHGLISSHKIYLLPP